MQPFASRLRTKRYKLIHFYTDDIWEFYDLEKDPYEVHNGYGDPEYSDAIQELKAGLEELREHYEVPPDHFKPPYVKAGKNQQL